MEGQGVRELDAALRALIAALCTEARLDAGSVRTAVAALDGPASFAYPAEELAVARAVESRRREFATGRRLAHVLLAELGCQAAPLVPDERRRPQWPAQVVGSIAHSRRAAAVVVGRSDELAALGLDLEEDGPLTPELAATVLTPQEVRRNAALPGDPLTWAKVAFCAKECAYKAWSPCVGRVLEFEEVEIELDAGRGRFEARLVGSSADLLGRAATYGATLCGGFARAPGHVIAAVLLGRTLR
jgi:4'-phosphopantetheinyl transferase EntD